MSGSLVYVGTQDPSALEGTAIAHFNGASRIFKIEKRVPQVTTIFSQLSETALEGRSDAVGIVVCVPETPPNTREQSPIARFQCCTLMQMVQTCKITAKLSKPKF